MSHTLPTSTSYHSMRSSSEHAQRALMRSSMSWSIDEASGSSRIDCAAAARQGVW
jgi:hypothetical protein